MGFILALMFPPVYFSLLLPRPALPSATSEPVDDLFVRIPAVNLARALLLDVAGSGLAHARPKMQKQYRGSYTVWNNKGVADLATVDDVQRVKGGPGSQVDVASLSRGARERESGNSC